MPTKNFICLYSQRVPHFHFEFSIAVPSRYPEKIRGVALTTTSMAFQWDRVYPGFIHGIPTGYKLRVIETDNPSNEVASLTIPYPERYHYVEGLKKYTNYTMWVSVLNRKGEGPVNPRGNINSTGEDGKMTLSILRIRTLEKFFRRT